MVQPQAWVGQPPKASRILGTGDLLVVSHPKTRYGQFNYRPGRLNRRQPLAVALFPGYGWSNRRSLAVYPKRRSWLHHGRCLKRTGRRRWASPKDRCLRLSGSTAQGTGGSVTGLGGSITESTQNPGYVRFSHPAWAVYSSSAA
ncbi:hypothetical protein B296_00015688 [Ensete ventricosum]|uniref:Uncharacterized protein n=1 Tax=Ensete ventricosum TaxID=4639 RepID=A0A426ZKQ2_ENSVE|nr:hypothetical protein B296_00015688 [Ensete ventricosum]